MSAEVTLPAAGGSYIRHPQTGSLSRASDAAPAPVQSKPQGGVKASANKER